MLVVSRKENDRIVFPGLGISVEVVNCSRSGVRLGVEAPRSIRVLRHELLDDLSQDEPTSILDVAEKKVRHELRNQLNRATLKLQLASKMLEKGDSDAGLSNLTRAIADLRSLESGEEVLHQLPADELDWSLSKSDTGSRKLKVLLVDDDANERALLASYLQRCGLLVRQASDGMEALYSLSNTEKPDVVLLDMNMPRMDGRTTVNRIRTCSQHRDVPVFAVTGETMEDCGLEVGRGGVTGWFQKPIEANEIVNAIQGCLKTNDN